MGFICICQWLTILGFIISYENLYKSQPEHAL